MKNLGHSVLPQLTALLKGGQAHATFDDAVKALPTRLRGKVPAGLPYSIWQLVEHIRIAQLDILDFSRNTGPNGKPPYKPMRWPADYWPKSPESPTPTAWTHSLRQVRADRDAFLQLLRAATKSNTLHTPFPWAAKEKNPTNHTLFQKALLIADHTSYHTAEIITVRRLLGAWK